MGIFKRKSVPRPEVVQVSFRDLGDRVDQDTFDGHGYAYLWPFAESPQLGCWAIAEGIDGPTTVIVRALGLPPHARGIELKTLLRLIPQTEVDAARAARDAPTLAWLDMARKAAGLSVARPVHTSPPPGFDALPPTQGNADAATADHFGDVWWRACKRADEFGRDPEDIANYEQVARGWYRARDRAAREEQAADIRGLASSIDLPAAIRQVGTRPRGEVEAMLFAGKPLWDWLKYAEDLARQKRDHEALELVLALVTCAEQESRLSGREPAPAYTERAAILYRKQKQYGAEIAVIERWEGACPPERRGPGVTQAKLSARLTKARQLAAGGA